jgi:hypothetical protein
LKLPWIKWFPTDWLSDAELSKTTLLGRGLWIEALNAMYNSDTHTLSGSPEELSRVLRCSVAEFDTALIDLQHHNAAIVGVRNGVVTLTSRRIERMLKKRKQGSLRVSKFRSNRGCNAESASASASASESPPRIGDRGKGRNIVPQLKLEVGKHFRRGPNDRWGYEEEYALVEVCKRPAALEEWTEILGYYRLEGSAPRYSVKSLLENWGGELDKARSHKPETGKPEVESIAVRKLRQAAKGL